MAPSLWPLPRLTTGRGRRWGRYAIQNFLEVDPHLGTREDLVELVKVAHSLGLYAILSWLASTPIHVWGSSVIAHDVTGMYFWT
jgi:maltooligosyltrehalose synthase